MVLDRSDFSERRDRRDGSGMAPVFHALVFRIALVRVGRRAWGFEHRPPSPRLRRAGMDRKGALILWIAATQQVFERTDSVRRRNDSRPMVLDRSDFSERRDQRDGLGMASVFHTLVFCIALIRVVRRASCIERRDSLKRRADPPDRADANVC